MLSIEETYKLIISLRGIDIREPFLYQINVQAFKEWVENQVVVQEPQIKSTMFGIEVIQSSAIDRGTVILLSKPNNSLASLLSFETMIKGLCNAYTPIIVHNIDFSKENTGVHE